MDVGSRPCIRRFTAACWSPRRGRRRHGAARHRAHRSAGGEPLTVCRHRGLGPAAATADAVESIDIGGPGDAAAAAKNHEWVLETSSTRRTMRCCSPARHAPGRQWNWPRAHASRAKAFSHTAHSRRAGRRLPSSQQARPVEALPPPCRSMFEKVQDLRYGENPHQSAPL